MEITTTTIEQKPTRRAAVNALAIIGFIALLIIGIGLAIISAQNMPKLGSRLGAAAVSFTSIFRPADETPSLQVVTTATTTLPIEDAIVIATSTPEATSTPVKNTTHAGTATRTVTTTVTQPVAPYGDPDLTVKITDVGYLRRDGNTDSFVAASNIDSSDDGAVKFTVTNTGTNVTGSWKFTVDVPTSPTVHFTSPTQKSLKPGDRIDYVLGFEKGKKGDNRNITVTVDSGKDVRESSEGNNSDSEEVDIRS